MKTTAINGNIIAFDIETFNNGKDLTHIVFAARNKFVRLYLLTGFVDAIESFIDNYRKERSKEKVKGKSLKDYQSYTLIGFNNAKYDNFYLWSDVDRLKYRYYVDAIKHEQMIKGSYTLTLYKNKITFMRVKTCKRGYMIYIYDIRDMNPYGTLDDYVRLYTNKEVMKGKYDKKWALWKWEDLSVEEQTKVNEYAFQDGLVTYEVIKQTFLRYNIKQPTTLPRYAYNQIDKEFQKCLKVKYTPFYEYAQKYKVGGICAYHVNKGQKIIENVYKYDINSSYPHQMRLGIAVERKYFPNCKRLIRMGLVNLEEGLNWKDEYRIFSSFYKNKRKVFISEQELTLLNTILNEKLSFDTWQDFAYVSNLEKFVLVHHKIKQETKDPVIKMIAKNTINSLSGKFGQAFTFPNLYRYDIPNYNAKNKIINVNEIKEQKGNFTEKPSLNAFLHIPNVQYSKNEKYYNPIVYNSITSLARVSLLSLIIKYRKHWVYSDTDSLILTCPLDPNYVGNDLGLWKLEKVAKYCIIMDHKRYLLSDNYTLNKDTSNVVLSGANNIDHWYGKTLDKLLTLYKKKQLTVYTTSTKRENFKIRIWQITKTLIPNELAKLI